MPHPCPRPCGRLATAVVFVSIGVVQFIAGLILLKSKYVYLLSGPDFWTAASNFAVGVLLGVSASVWKDVQRTSFRHIVRRNILASLVASAIIINSTTAIILILGEGNALLSIQLENDGKYSSASEILAYSYATSVCSPIVSVVVAFVFLSGMWFRVSDKGSKTPEIKSILKKNSFSDYNWVFKEKPSPTKKDSKTLRKELSFKSLSSSSDDESFSLTDAKLWSNSVRSIEFLNTSSRRESHRLDMLRHNRVQQELTCECGEHVKNTPESIRRDLSRVSFIDDGKYLKYSPHTSRSHLEFDSPFHSDRNKAGDKNVSSLSYAEFKKMHRHFENSKQHRKKKRMLLMEHPAFQKSKFLEDDINAQNLHKLVSPEIYIPRARARMASKNNLTSSVVSEVKAEMHVDPKGQDLVDDGNFPNSPVVHYVGDVPSCDASIETTRNKNATFQRASTFKHLNNSDASQPKGNDSVNRKVYRTSTADPNSSKISQLDISDIQTDSVIDQNESYKSIEEKDISLVASTQPVISQMDSNTELDDSFIDEPQSNALAGEVVKVHVNSLPRTRFHSKLIPVPIPVVSSIKKNPLKRKQKESTIMAIDNLSGRSELSFSSFHGDLKPKNRDDHHHIQTDKGNQKHKAVNDVTVCEMSPDDKIPPSPAHTSGYDSAIFESTHLSNSECFKPNISSSETNSPYYTPKKKFLNFPSPRKLDVVHIEASE
ncbi:hypothetical protein HNY73_000645 [Argiope bruennichi]|uniref:Uncharacterized protein n=1 Tax=Argiope bruennichi TaxID=94029 RepID=A0A8T0G1B0_ARGBR|nr:hypothetical protein HNY73_000645 [Argiope bruennichi]